MNYSRQIAWAVILGILSAAAPSISAQSGVHTDGGAHKMLHRMILCGLMSRHYRPAPNLPS
jgi:hypothetical protein